MFHATKDVRCLRAIASASIRFECVGRCSSLANVGDRTSVRRIVMSVNDLTGRVRTDVPCFSREITLVRFMSNNEVFSGLAERRPRCGIKHK